MNPSQSIFPMNDQHKAKPEELHYIKHWAVCRPVESGVYELLNRIEALEAAATAKPNYPEIPDGSLVERVAAVIDNGTACDRDPRRMVGDVIRAVAAWLRKHYGGPTATTHLLEEEVKR